MRFGVTTILALTAGCHRPISVGTDARVLAFREQRLAPAHLPPPSVDGGTRTVGDGVVSVTVRPVRAEDQAWNRWGAGPELRLFNNAAAWLFEVEVTGPGPLGWIPGRTILEVNDPGRGLPALASPEPLLDPLVGHAWLEADGGGPVELAERTRAAGPFRAAWLPLRVDEGPLSGVIGFPIGAAADVHVVAFRLTLALESAGVEHSLVAVFD